MNYKKILVFLTFILFAIPLLIYPLVIVANIMTLAGESSGKEAPFLNIIIISFVTATSLYPLTYIFSLIFYNIKGKLHKKLWVLLSPAFHLILTMTLFLIWKMFES
ncbi:hypothetical protein ABE099_10925 [Paenibacillus turicensis]|uniref:hypothetical protein n=1 Tax=Paenibacillus turicensis TaxID=160487 RepID=UPI003D2DA5A8